MSLGGRLAASEPPKRSTTATLESSYSFYSKHTYTPLPPEPKDSKTISSCYYKTIICIIGSSGNGRAQPATPEPVLRTRHSLLYSLPSQSEISVAPPPHLRWSPQNPSVCKHSRGACLLVPLLMAGGRQSAVPSFSGGTRMAMKGTNLSGLSSAQTLGAEPCLECSASAPV